MDLAVETRDVVLKPAALRAKGLIPAELYGHGIQNAHLAVDARAFSKVYREAGENTIVTLTFGKEKRPVLIYDVQKNYLSDVVDHIDFYQVRMDEKITAKVPIEFTGEAPAVKEKGGLLNASLSEIEVEALPGDLPHRFVVDLSVLAEINQSLYVKDILVPKGVEVLVDLGTAIATVTEKMKEEEIAPAPTADVSEVKVESEEKKAERDQAKAAAEAEEKK
jgi:large subunit ribosomal protein L25